MKRLEFRNRGTVPGEMYTREDMAGLLCDFQDEIVRDYRTRFNKSLYNRKYFTRDLEVTAAGYGIADSKEFRELKKELDHTGEVISELRSRISCQDRARRVLSRTLPGEEMEVLYGISLRNGKDVTEYDAVVITPYGVFVIDVRDPGRSKDIDERIEEGKLNLKECLLRNRLREFLNVPFYSILLIAENRPNAADRLGWVPKSYLNTIMWDIRSYGNGKRYISSDEMKRISDVLRRNDSKALFECPVDCVKILDDYMGFVIRCSDRTAKGLLQKIRDIVNGKPKEDVNAEIA